MGCYYQHSISTHAPLAGRDRLTVKARVRAGISTHAPLAGRDGKIYVDKDKKLISTHAPLAGRDLDFRDAAWN